MGGQFFAGRVTVAERYAPAFADVQDAVGGVIQVGNGCQIAGDLFRVGQGVVSQEERPGRESGE